MSVNSLGKVIYGLAVVACVGAFAGCSSPSGTEVSQSTDRNSESVPPDAKKRMATFVAQMSAVYRALGEDVKKGGYHLVFTGIAPENLERDMPDVFATLRKKGSGRGVEFRSYTNAIIDTASVRDRKTGEQGVVFTLVDMKDNGHGGLDVSGAWSETKDAWREVKYHVVPDGEKWRVQ